MFKLLQRIFTKNLKEIPLFYITFNFNHYKNKGKIGSCMTHIHPLLKDDDNIKTTLNNLIDYIRNKYDMEEM